MLTISKGKKKEKKSKSKFAQNQIMNRFTVNMTQPSNYGHIECISHNKWHHNPSFYS